MRCTLTVGKKNDQLAEQVKLVLETTIGEPPPIPREYMEYVLCKMYHCTPSQLAREDYNVTELHFQFMLAEQEARRLNQERTEWERKAHGK